MRKNLKAKAYIYPLPVLIVGTYDEAGTPNAMTAAWGTVCDTAQVAICLSHTHKTVQNLLKKGAFSVSIADRANVVEADYVGILSGNKSPEKIEKTGWQAQKGEFVDAPIFDKLPLTMECKLVSYDVDTEICIGEVVNVSAEEGILDESGAIDLAKFQPIAYASGVRDYYVLGEKVGKAYSDGKKLL